ncbi:BC1881 family protein [Paenibacillus woosongensis]|uniref:BC1881 family protein n=1 Tax=Paenibacillus woosongensis TaxID=307580 RepID=A0A7X2Z382_9BACL|nr:BC1881 family protein [Paenibacillus woosongensis]
MSNVLNKELAARVGIEVIEVNFHGGFKITTGQKEMMPTGPATIFG